MEDHPSQEAAVTRPLLVPPPIVAAVLSPEERTRDDAAGDGSFDLVRRDSLRDAIRMVRERPVDAVLVSVRRCVGKEPALLEQFTRAFPAVPTIALVTLRSARDTEAVLRIGATGVRQVVDASEPGGWRRRREVLGHAPQERSQAILVPLYAALGPLPPGTRRFWDELVRTAPVTGTIRELALRLDVTPSTLVSRFVRDPDEVQDVVQEAFIKAYRALPGFRGESAFYTWLYRIAVNTAKNYLVAHKRQPVSSDVLAEDAENFEDGALLRDIATPDAELQTKQIAKAVNEAVEALPEELRTAITLREIEGMSYEEIAQMMACPIGTVRSRIFRAREAIAEKIRPMLGTSQDKRW